MEISEKIDELMKISSKNGFTFFYQKEGEENYIKILDETKKLIVNLPKYEDNEFGIEIDRVIEELNQRFQ